MGNNKTELRGLYQQVIEILTALNSGKQFSEIRDGKVMPTDSLGFNQSNILEAILILGNRINDVNISLELLRNTTVTEGILDGLEITTVDNKNIKITAGSGITPGKELLVLGYDVVVNAALPLDLGVYYVVLEKDNNISIRDTEVELGVTVSKLIIQNSISVMVYDDRENDFDGYVFSAREETFSNDFKINDSTIPQLRNFMTELLASNLIGEIRLNENLTLSNDRGTMQASSESIQFFNNAGAELAKYGGTEARIGNIILELSLLQMQ